MKLKEIILERDIKTRYVGPDAHVEPRLLGKIKKLGGGVQGTAFKHPRIPNTVIKTAGIVNPERDGYLKFIKLALDHQDNPFFPKIYNAVLRSRHTGTKDAHELIIQMERLHKISSDELIEIAPQLFARLGFNIEDINDMWDYLNDPSTWEYLIKKTKNPKFAEALQLILDINPSLRGHDLHLGNWMIRLTSAGPQLVIIDPFMGIV